jgi:hypothetical protein
VGSVFEVDVRGLEALGVLRNPSKRMSFVLANALNKTIKVVQPAEVRNVKRGFTVRQPTFIERNAAAIRGKGGGSGFASAPAHRFSARIEVSEKPRFLLGGFERGGPRPVAKGKSAAVPLIGGAARPTFGVPVVPQFTFKELRFVTGRRGKGRMVSDFVGSKFKSRRKASTFKTGDVLFKQRRTGSGKVQWKGAQRTFILKSTGKLPGGGVFQRVGPGRDDIRLIYSFVQHERLEHRLGFEKVALREALAAFPKFLRAEIDSAFQFAATRAFGK